MWTVEYRCLYRERWYTDEAPAPLQSWNDARARCVVLHLMTGRRVRAVDPDGHVRFELPPPA